MKAPFEDIRINDLDIDLAQPSQEAPASFVHTEAEIESQVRLTTASGNTK